MENLGAVTHGFRQARCAHGQDHELLHIDAVIRMGAAVNDVHHRHGHVKRSVTAQVTIQGQTSIGCRGMGNGHGNGQYRVGAQPALVFRAVEFQHCPIDAGLVAGFHTNQLRAQDILYIAYCLQHALAAVAAGVVVP